jgi:hypothetical protein
MCHGARYSSVTARWSCMCGVMGLNHGQVKFFFQAGAMLLIHITQRITVTKSCIFQNLQC